jgi:hypothetical protein
MRKHSPSSFINWLAVAAWLAASLCVVAIRAQAQAPTDDKGSTRPLLKQLNEETQSLYKEVQTGVVRVQLPPPKWAAAPALADEDQPLKKWADQLDPAVKQALDQEQKRAAKGQRPKLIPSVANASTQPTKATTQPATTQHGQHPLQQAVGAWSISTTGDDTITLRPSSAGAGALRMNAGGGIDPQGNIIAGNGPLQLDVAAGGYFTPNNIGLVLDDQGHVLVPVAVEKESFDGEEIRVMVGQSEMTTARFVASDRQTNVTLLKLAKPLGTPVKLTDHRPAEGNLTMFLAPNSGVGRLIIWTNELRDWGVVVSMDGKIHGFTRHGQFLTAAGCKPVIQQLLASGAVKRARLGLAIAEIPATDETRQTTPMLASRPAVRVEEVAPDSPAARSGLRQGDLIVSVNNEPVGDPSSFAAAMTSDNPAAPVKVTILRNGAEQGISIQSAMD